MRMMNRKDLHQFIRFMTHHKGLTHEQTLRRDRLLTRDYLSEQQITSNTPVDDSDAHRPGIKDSYLSPKNLQRFLMKYNQNPILKYTSHLIDSDEVIESICEECETDTYNFNSHCELIREQYRYLLRELNFNENYIPRNMIGLISAYLGFSGEKWSSGTFDVSWRDAGLMKWAEEHPGKVPCPGKNIARKQRCNGYRLEKPYKSPLTGAPLSMFSELVLCFKSLFHIRLDNSLKKLISYKNKELEGNTSIPFPEVVFTENFRENLELFTDVDKLLQAYADVVKICAEKCEGDDRAKLQLSFYEEGEDKFFVIHHVNSVYGKSMTNATERIGESQTLLIQSKINGMCDLYIEADFGNGEYARVNLWDESPYLQAEEIDKMEGVKYILKF